MYHRIQILRSDKDGVFVCKKPPFALMGDTAIDTLIERDPCEIPPKSPLPEPTRQAVWCQGSSTLGQLIDFLTSHDFPTSYPLGIRHNESGEIDIYFTEK